MAMKYFLKSAFVFLFATVVSTTAFAQQGDNDKLTAEAKEFEKLAMDNYMRTPDSAVANFRKAAELYARAGNHKTAAAILQNGAFVYDTYKKDHYKAAEIMRESLVNWRKTTDTPAIANAYRYTIIQYTKFNDAVSVGKWRDTAITFFAALNDYKSVSELYLITAAMYENQRLPDSAIRYAILARDISNKSVTPQLTLFKAENVLFREYVVAQKYKEAKALIKKLQKNIDLQGLSKDDKMGFYYYAWVYYNNNDDAKKTAEYKTEYDALKNSVK